MSPVSRPQSPARVVAGGYSGSVTFNNITLSTTTGNTGIFIAKLDAGITSVNDQQYNSNWNIFPNPSNSVLKVVADFKENHSYTVSVYNSLGQNINSSEAKGNGISFAELDLSGIPAGLYTVVLSGPGVSGVQKIIIE